MKKVSRRSLLNASGGLAALGIMNEFSPLMRSFPASAQSVPSSKLITIFLNGGWDSTLGTDPVVGDKLNSSIYAPEYKPADMKKAVDGKPNLIVGKGLETAIPAFASMPTAFVNGIYIEVTAHELASRYMYSGKESLTVSREYPSLAAILSGTRDSFPSHVVVGSEPPLGDTARTRPPLVAPGLKQLVAMLAGPTDTLYTPLTAKDKRLVSKESVGFAQEYARMLDASYLASLDESSQKSLLTWRKSGEASDAMYQKHFQDKMLDHKEALLRYNAGVNDDESTIGGRISSALFVLKSGLSPFVTVNFGGFDTHDDHLKRHLPILTNVGTAIAQLVEDLRRTPDPHSPELSLADTTTILITSDFVRTPHFNLVNGTDHWQSGSAIVMGKGVRDNVVLGKTDMNAAALGWDGTAAVPFSEATALKPDHLISALLRNFDLDNLASEIAKEGKLNALFI